MANYLELVLKQTAASELAAPLPASDYSWRTYSGTRGKNLTTTNGKRTVKLVKGSKFGLRPSSNGKTVRLITEETGPTIVFTLTQAQAEKLEAVSKKSGAKTKAVTPKTAKDTKKSDTEFVSDKEVRATLKSIFDRSTPNEDTIKALKAVEKLFNSFDQLTPKQFDKLKKIKASSRFIKLFPGDSKAVKQAYTLGRKYLNSGIKTGESIFFSDAASMFELMHIVGNKNKKKAANFFVDTSVREAMPEHLYDVYRKLQGWV